MSPVHVFSFGGGVQSTACLVLAARGELPASETSFRWDAFVFANVGEKAEHPGTLQYVNEVAKPFAETNGIELVEARKVRRTGEVADLYNDVMMPSRSINIPVRMTNGAPGQRRCTHDFKIKVVAKELRARGATKNEPGTVGIGISMDELQRARNWGEIDPREPFQIKEYPLLRLGLRRQDCLDIIKEAGLPQPPRSACWFCPFHSLDEWRRLYREEPDLFQKAVEMESVINARRAELGKDNVWLTRFARPLNEVIHDQLVFGLDDPGTDDAPCDSGHCFT